MNSEEFKPTLDALVKKCGYGAATQIIEEKFSPNYRVHHHNDHKLYVGMTRDEINRSYQSRKLDVLQRWLSIFYGVKV